MVDVLCTFCLCLCLSVFPSAFCLPDCLFFFVNCFSSYCQFVLVYHKAFPAYEIKLNEVVSYHNSNVSYIRLLLYPYLTLFSNSRNTFSKSLSSFYFLFFSPIAFFFSLYRYITFFLSFSPITGLITSFFL